MLERSEVDPLKLGLDQSSTLRREVDSRLLAASICGIIILTQALAATAVKNEWCRKLTYGFEVFTISWERLKIMRIQ